ncbi:polysaccharide deacetylase [Ruminococcus albus SY3]|uniref:Polysaccharide deacetylase n=1 Tax=Ruminococcus albus SY3 TaxID=1341156 RepID=A0A011WL15_RUMAL|nr:polysaccharide deacetylase family protein [Ruminococcus albus]EXM37735.1 polysaccharide deacetylase [Ruminococcus albus SY3]
MFKTIKLNKLLLGILLPAVIAIGAGMTSTFAAQEDKPEKSRKEGVPVPIIMYHSITLDDDCLSEYVVSLDQIESDIEYLKEKDFTPVFVNDLIRYVNYGGELPDKPIILTFDDGFYNNREYLYGLLKKEDFKATISVVGDYTINASESGEKQSALYSYLSWKDIAEMRESGRYEFCDHSCSMHSLGERRGVLKKEGESDDEYRHALISDIDGLQKLFETNCGFRPNVFTYPYGFYCDEAEETVKALGFEATLGVEEKPNYIIKNDSECLYGLNRYNRSGLTDTISFMENMLKDFENS